MNRQHAKIIAETITNNQLAVMFHNAKIGINDWSQVSNVNKGMSKGAAWNILYNAYDPSKNTSYLGKVNMIREFGDFIENVSSEFNLPKRKSHGNPAVHHEEPKF